VAAKEGNKLIHFRFITCFVVVLFSFLLENVSIFIEGKVSSSFILAEPDGFINIYNV